MGFGLASELALERMLGLGRRVEPGLQRVGARGLEMQAREGWVRKEAVQPRRGAESYFAEAQRGKRMSWGSFHGLRFPLGDPRRALEISVCRTVRRARETLVPTPCRGDVAC
jgi:hypothetical protein